MKTLLTCNLSTKIALAGNEPWVPPIFTYGESLTLALRFQRNVDGETIEPALDVRGLTAAIGSVDERPVSGEWALQVGAGAQTAGNTTGALQPDCSAAALATAINAKTAIVAAHGTARVRKIEGSWLVAFGTGAVAVPLTVRDNDLSPVSLGRIAAEAIAGEWQHEVRLIQMPLAFTDGSERILPHPPSITRVRAGGSGGGYSWNEIQALYVPPDFRGTYSLKYGFARTGQLSVSDTAETVQAALVAAAGANFTVTNPAPFTAHIEFDGDLAGVPGIALLEVLPLDPPPGDLTFTLALDRGALLARLRAEPLLILPLEVRLRTADEEEVTTEQVAFRLDVLIRRPVIFPALALVPVIDWMRPASPKDYIPRSETTVFVGDKSVAVPVGDGESTGFVIAHTLASDDVLVWVRENVSNGRQLIDGTDFTVRIVSASSVLVTALLGAPALNAWIAYIKTAEPIAAFADGLVISIGQVTGLGDRIGGIEDTLGEILALLPTTPIGSTTSAQDDTIEIEIPNITDLIPRHPGEAIDLAKLPRAGGLLPAIHDAAATDVSALPSISDAAGNVYRNTSGAALLLPGGLGYRSSNVAINGFFGGDSRRIYPLTRQGSTTSYFPRDLERQLFMFEVNAQMLRSSRTLTLEFKLALQLLNATSRAQYLVVVEHGIAPSQSSPATTAENLQDIVWNATPLLSQRLILGDNKVTHRFGVQVIRAANGVLAANKVLYGFSTAAGAIPASADLALRARLINFDTENSVTNAKGLVFLALLDGKATIA